jgi:hypothetical protein
MSSDGFESKVILSLSTHIYNAYVGVVEFIFKLSTSVFDKVIGKVSSF